MPPNTWSFPDSWRKNVSATPAFIKTHGGVLPVTPTWPVVIRTNQAAAKVPHGKGVGQGGPDLVRTAALTANAYVACALPCGRSIKPHYFIKDVLKMRGNLEVSVMGMGRPRRYR